MLTILEYEQMLGLSSQVVTLVQCSVEGDHRESDIQKTFESVGSLQCVIYI